MDYVYYKLFQFASRGTTSTIPHFGAAAYMAMLLSLNTLTLTSLTSKFTGYPNFMLDVEVDIGIFLLLIIVLYIVYNNRGMGVIARFEKQKRKIRIVRNAVFYVYLILSILSLFVVPFYIHGKL